MKKGLLLLLATASFCVANAAEPRQDMFKGKLFPPNIIMQHQAELRLSKEQFTEIRAAVVAVQAGVAELPGESLPHSLGRFAGGVVHLVGAGVDREDRTAGARSAVPGVDQQAPIAGVELGDHASRVVRQQETIV